MHPVPHRPARGNWIWLATGLTAGCVLIAAALHFAGAGACPAPASAASAPQATGPGLTGPGHAVATGTDANPRASAGASAGPVRSGLALYYDPGTAVGSCSLGPFPAGGLYVSLPPQQYLRGAACGSYLDVHGPDGSVRAEVVDLCPGCGATTINLSRAAFGRIAEPAPGSAQVTYRRAGDPPLPGPIEVRVSTSTAPGLPALQILHHGNPLTSVAIAASTGGTGAGAAARWHRLTLTANNFWVPTVSHLSGPVDLRITDDLGHRVTLRRLRLDPGSTIRSAVWMYQMPAPAPRARATGTPPSAPPSAPPSTKAATCQRPR